MDDTRRYRLNAAECLFAAKTCRSGYREIILSISTCWHLLARQDEATNTLFANWTLRKPLEPMAGGLHAEQEAPDGVQVSA